MVVFKCIHPTSYCNSGDGYVGNFMVLEIDEKKKQEKLALWLKNLPAYDDVARFVNVDPWGGLFSITHKYGIFEIFTKELVDELATFIIKEFGQSAKVIEACAGDGRLTKALQDKGLNIVGVDTRIRKDITYPGFISNRDALSCIQTVKPDVIIASWIEYGSKLDIDLVMTGIPLIIIGETHGGCTGSSDFWEREDFTYKKLDAISKYNISRTDYNMGDQICHHTSTYLVKLKKASPPNTPMRQEE